MSRQDAFVRAWSKLGQFRAGATFKTWVLAIAWNRAISRRRRLAGWWRRASPLDDARGAADSARRPDQAAGDSELRAQIARAIERLTPKLRDTLLLAQSGEYDYAEIAVMLSIPVGTVKWRVAEARRKVRAALMELGYVDAR
jgi:RNA polymerase sigma-70 factor (ECF subfamily)